MSAVAHATGLARNTITASILELERRREHPGDPITLRIRRAGAGRKSPAPTDPELSGALAALVDPLTRGHPESPPLWTCRSTAKSAAELRREEHPDRNAQFEHIHRQVRHFQRGRQPVVTVDTKK